MAATLRSKFTCMMMMVSWTCRESHYVSFNLNFGNTGLLLATEPTMNIREDSVMTRQLCIASQENGELERNVSVSLSLISSGYGIEGMFPTN